MALNLKVGNTKERVSFLVGSFTDEAILGMNDLQTFPKVFNSILVP